MWAMVATWQNQYRTTINSYRLFVEEVVNPVYKVGHIREGKRKDLPQKKNQTHSVQYFKLSSVYVIVPYQMFISRKT